MITSRVITLSIFSFLTVGATFGQSALSSDLNSRLLEAVRSRNTRAVQDLLKQGADLEARDENEFTPLIEAATYDDLPMVKLLVDKGADIRAKNRSLDNALMTAARGANSEMVEFLLARTADVQSKNDALLEAAGSGPVGRVELSNEEAAQLGLQITRTTVIQDPPWVKNVKLLLASGAEVDARAENGDTPLIRAAGHGQTEIVRLLLANGADVEATDQGGFSALAAAACECAQATMNDTVDIEKMLLEKRGAKGAKDAQGGLALVSAAGWGRTENARLMLDHGADIEARDDDGNTALLIAASGSALSTLDTVSMLLERGADMEARNNKGETALMLAASEDGSEYQDMVKLLLAKGANPHAADAGGNTALGLAAKKGRDDVVRLLRQALAKAH